jgi:uncharacterized protein YbjT (DUF2867 family)
VSDLVLITGATGKTGRSLASLLRENGTPYRAASRNGEPPFDWFDPHTWEAALVGVGSVYLVAPPAAGDAYSRMLTFIKKAMQKDARRFVLLSMASLPAGGPGPGQIHLWLRDNSPDWAVLCPTAFMENFSEGPFVASIRDEDAIYSNTGAGRVPFISTVDIAQAALAALTSPTPLNTDFTLTGDESISYDRVAQLISHACDRLISHRHISTAAMAKRFIARGLPEPNAIFLAAGYQTIADGAQDRLAEDFRALTGRPSTTFPAFAKANKAAWKPV